MRLPVICFGVALLPFTAFAEWRTESFTLKAGWNAIYPFVDAGHETIETTFDAHPQVEEIWRWQPERVDPRTPSTTDAPPVGVEWSVWKRGQPEESTFQEIRGNYGYLVRLQEGAANRTVEIKGRPVIPQVRWRNDGLHLIGFPVIAGTNGPTYSNYLGPTGFPLGSTPILRYVGGPIAPSTNPMQINPTVSRIVRGEAYWIRVEEFSRYYGPLKVELASGDEAAFGTGSSIERMVLTNLTGNDLGITIVPQASESPPPGQSVIADQLPLLVQVDAETEWTPLANRSITLAPKATMQIRLVPDRLSPTMQAAPVGNRFATLLRFNTNTGVTGQDMYIPATAEVGSVAGLWVGEISIDQVGSILRRYQRDAAGNTVHDSNGNPILIEDLTTPSDTEDLPAVPNPYPLRLLVHVNASGQATVLSHIHQGILAAAPPEEPVGLVLDESLLDPTTLQSATRLSVAHLPVDTRLVLPGTFGPGGLLTAPSLLTPHTAKDNPFIHAYHPDHDNLDARFNTVLPPGRESFNISRVISLEIDATAPTDSPPSWGTQLMTGWYQENITGITRPDSLLRIRGPFALYKVSDIPFISEN